MHFIVHVFFSLFSVSQADSAIFKFLYICSGKHETFSFRVLYCL